MKKFIVLLLAALLIAGVFISCKQDPPTYTVSFNNNGGKGSMDSISGKAGTNVTIPAGTGDIYNQNYRFISWNTKEDGSGTEYESEDVIEKIQANVTLYAQWESLFEVLEGTNWTCTTTAGALDMDMDDPPISVSDIINVRMSTDDEGGFSITFNHATYGDLATVSGTYSFNAGSETDGVMDGTMTYNPPIGGSDPVSGTIHIVDDNQITIYVTKVDEKTYNPPLEIALSRPEID